MAEKDIVAALDLIVEKLKDISASGQPLTAEQLERIVEKAAGASADTLKTALIPENKIVPLISVFAPEGEAKKPKLSRRTIFCQRDQSADQLTPTEIEAFNAITQDCEARDGRWWARIGRDGLKPVLIVHCDEAVDRDQARDLPPLTHILLELKRGPKAVDPLELLAQLDTMRAQLVAAGVTIPAGVVTPSRDGQALAQPVV